ncbi:putrescine ABC transporter permease PotI [Salipiger pallidus]|uniref:Putrescine ABC transporter permease PotI n=1 Tax=Salipiger pallidus TaxID=1775170 RepID=A0A8J2ZJ03_9RHOB|nr:ABC transporter permease [Salipiger pallidus]GGG68607.1 putrescine ABC transporter permease PotI [Salipiger pallidus]
MDILGSKTANKALLALVLALTYLFLYVPILHITLASFSDDIVWPYPIRFTWDAYTALFTSSIYAEALWNSLLLGFGTAVLSTTLATIAVLGLLKYRSRWKGLILFLFVAPLFVADVLLGISTLILNGLFLDIPGNIWSAILANTVRAFTYALLIIATQLFRYNWKLDDAAMVFGAGPVRTFFEITLPNIWPALLGAFITTFILSFNNLDISFYTLGAVPTMPSVAWGSLRFGIKPELYAIAALVNAGVLLCLAVMFGLMRTGTVGFGFKEGRDD